MTLSEAAGARTAQGRNGVRPAVSWTRHGQRLGDPGRASSTASVGTDALVARRTCAQGPDVSRRGRRRPMRDGDVRCGWTMPGVDGNLQERLIDESALQPADPDGLSRPVREHHRGRGSGKLTDAEWHHAAAPLSVTELTIVGGPRPRPGRVHRRSWQETAERVRAAEPDQNVVPSLSINYRGAERRSWRKAECHSGAVPLGTPNVPTLHPLGSGPPSYNGMLLSRILVLRSSTNPWARRAFGRTGSALRHRRLPAFRAEVPRQSRPRRMSKGLRVRPGRPHPNPRGRSARV